MSEVTEKAFLKIGGVEYAVDGAFDWFPPSRPAEPIIVTLPISDTAYDCLWSWAELVRAEQARDGFERAMIYCPPIRRPSLMCGASAHALAGDYFNKRESGSDLLVHGTLGA